MVSVCSVRAKPDPKKRCAAARDPERIGRCPRQLRQGRDRPKMMPSVHVGAVSSGLNLCGEPYEDRVSVKGARRCPGHLEIVRDPRPPPEPRAGALAEPAPIGSDRKNKRRHGSYRFFNALSH